MTDTRHPTDAVRRSEPLWQLTEVGQSVWLDYIRRGILDDGELERMIREDGVRGVTSNPAIFEQAIVQSDDYDEALDRLAAEGAKTITVYEALAIEDIQRAADLFREIYDASEKHDGFVSLEVSPELAHDTDGSLAEARRLWAAVNRPNVMIKIPGTPEGLPAIEELLYGGINVNVTLLFSLESYERVMAAFVRAMERRALEAKPLEGIASVASFFVSRVDSAVDQMLERRLEMAGAEAEIERLRCLFGRAAIANAKLAYERFREVFSGQRFTALREQGAQVQRPLWASTSTKNPSYRDVLYVEELIGPDTVNSMPLQTLEAFADHGVVRRTVDVDIEQAKADLAALAAEGIDLERITLQLQVEGVEKFVIPFRHMLGRLEEQLAAVVSRG